MKSIHIEDCSKIEIHIHVIGYFPKGESILVILWDGNDSTVLKSILIDSYQIDGNNKFEALLKHYSIDSSKLDYFIWTHPDLDHSLGIPEIIKNYTNKETRYLVPVGLTSKVLKSMKSALFRSWLSIKKRPRYSVSPISTSIRYSSAPNICQYYEDGINDDVKFSLEIVAPLSEVSFNETEKKKTPYKNDISIAFNIVLGNLRFFFGGDITNTTIRKISEEIFRNTVFVKIPHHGSDTSDELPNKYSNNEHDDTLDERYPIIAVSTIFEDHPTHLPKNDVLDLYKDLASHILLTNKLNPESNYGIWSIKYKLNSIKALNDPKPEGDANIYFNS